MKRHSLLRAWSHIKSWEWSIWIMISSEKLSECFRGWTLFSLLSGVVATIWFHGQCKIIYRLSCIPASLDFRENRNSMKSTTRIRHLRHSLKEFVTAIMWSSPLCGVNVATIWIITVLAQSTSHNEETSIASSSMELVFLVEHRWIPWRIRDPVWSKDW